MDATYQMMPRPVSPGLAVPRQRRSLLPVGIAATLFYLLLAPPQFNPTIAGVYLSPFRVFLLLATMYLMFGALRLRVRFAWPDLMIGLAAGWIWLASYMSSGEVSTAAIVGGSQTVDIALSYFLARLTIQTPTDLRHFLIMIAPGVIFTGVVVVVESITHVHIVQGIASALTGQPNLATREIRLRYFMRGAASFPHPILAGIVLASFLSIYVLSGLRGWPRLLGALGAVGGVFTMSSAAMLGLVVGGLLVAYDWLSERITNITWRLFLFFTAVLYVGVELTSDSGFYNLLVRYASLNSYSAYNRVLIWKYGTNNVEEHPWFGIGYSDWVRPDWMKSDSFDHFWLIMALRFGIPETVLLLGATLLALVMLAVKSSRLPPADGRLLRGVAISLGVFALGVNSVSLWMSALSWYFVLLGIAVSLGSMQTRPLAR